MRGIPPSMCGDLPAWYHTSQLPKIYLALHCQARDLEVNGGVWRGETTDVGYDTFPNGWGILQYNEADHLNRFPSIYFSLSRWKELLFKEDNEQGEV